MFSRAELHRRRAIEARQRAGSASDPALKAGFEEIAQNWQALAEQVEWLEQIAGIPADVAPSKPMQQQQQTQPERK
jgi:hypothetical protein